MTPPDGGPAGDGGVDADARASVGADADTGAAGRGDADPIGDADVETTGDADTDTTGDADAGTTPGVSPDEGDAGRDADAGRLDRGFGCDRCGAAWYYDRRRCPECGSTEWSGRPLGTGVLRSSTVSRVTPRGVREENPLGLAEFDGGVRVVAQLPGPEGERPAVGDAVRLAGEFELRERDGDRVVGPRLLAAADATGA